MGRGDARASCASPLGTPLLLHHPRRTLTTPGNWREPITMVVNDIIT